MDITRTCSKPGPQPRLTSQNKDKSNIILGTKDTGKYTLVLVPVDIIIICFTKVCMSQDQQMTKREDNVFL